MKIGLLILGLMISSSAIAAQFDVTGGFTCYRVLGPYPEYRNCFSSGIYESANCEGAFEQLRTQNSCCNRGEYSQFGGKSCTLKG